MEKERLYIGFDCHKETHYCVAINHQSKQTLSFELLNTFPEMNNCAKQFLKLEEQYQLIIGVEGSRNYGMHLTRTLQENNFEVFEICSNLTRSRRRTTWGTGKSDEIDALIVARAVRDECNNLLELNYDDATEGLIKLTSRRSDLVKIRSNELKRLHVLLTYLNPEYKKRGDICNKKVQKYWLEHCRREMTKVDNPFQKSKYECIKNLLYTLKFLAQSIESIEEEISKSRTKDVGILMSVSGIGLISACKIISHIGNITRFKNANKLASYCGLSPVTFASGNYSRAISNIRGNRKLNTVLYGVALTASRIDPISRAYYEKKQEEGKTKKQALRYLARRMLKVIHALLTKQEFYKKEFHAEKLIKLEKLA